MVIIRGTLRAVEHARRTGYRALIVVGDRDRVGAVRELARLAGGRCALIADKRARVGACQKELSPAKYRSILGGEYGAVIVSLPSMLRPSIVAAAGEAVAGGGFLALVGPPWERWSLGARGGPGNYKEYIGSRIGEARLHAWQDSGGLVSLRLDTGPAPDRGGEEWKSRSGVPRAVMRLARTRDQARLLDEMLEFLRGRERSLLVLGDRGRGKSYATGLGLSTGIYFKLVGNAAVVGPSEESVQQVFRGLVAGLASLGLAYRVRLRRRLIVRVSGPWYRVAYQPPNRPVQEPLVIIDEAAAVGPARARRLMWRAVKSIASTTIHGYEGSGLSLAHLMEQWLPRPARRVTMEEPVRYPPGDPLEEWIYETFMLRPEPAPGRLEGPPTYRLLSGGDLARDHSLLRSVYTILAQAHYRTTPDSILMLLDAPHHTVHALLSGGRVVAVAEVVDESVGGEAALASERLLLMGGEEPGRTARISRIAVAPGLQRRGLGSMLLGRVEEWARGEGFAVMATLFSRHEVVPFWLKNGYRPFYASPRYNKVTGEKNLGFAKPLTPESEEPVLSAARAFSRRLFLLAPSIYRDIAAETVALLLSQPSGAEPLPMTRGEERRLRLFLEGSIGYEQAMDAVLLALQRLVFERGLPSPGDRRTVLVTARVIQGKPLDEAASIARISVERASEELEQALRELLGGGSGAEP